MGRRFHPNQNLPSLSARDLNGWSRAADFVAQRDAEQNDSRGVAGTLPHLRCILQNDTGSDVADFHVFGLGALRVVSLSTDPQQLRRKLVFDAEAPVKATHGTKFAITWEPIKVGREGYGVIVGLVPVRINVTDEDHEFAAIDDADATRLASDGSEGVPIVWKESGTGEKWGVVNLGGGSGTAPDCEATIDDAISTDAGNMLTTGTDDRLYIGDGDVTSTDSGNLLGSGTDDLLLLTSGDINGAATGNLLQADSDGLSLTAADIADTEGDNLASSGPNDGVYVDPDDVKAAIPRSFFIRGIPDGSQSMSTTFAKVTMGSTVIAESPWNFDDANDEFEYTGSPDWVTARLQITHGGLSSTAAGFEFRLYRNGTTLVDRHQMKPGDNLTHSEATFQLNDFSPGTDPVYHIEAGTSAGTGTLLGTTIYNDFIEAEAYHR